MTVGRKGRGESSLRSQAVEVQSEGGKSAIETSAELTKTSEFTDDKAYRLILNGRSELMEVLGGIFDFNANMSAFYIWMWPFKQLVRYGDKVRARLAIEESKLKTENTSPGSPKFYGDGGMIPERGDLQPYCDTHFKSSPFTKENIKQSDDETRHQKTEDGRNAREYKTNMIEPHSMDFEHDPKSEGEARSNSTDPPLQNVEEGVETKEKAANTTHEPLQTPEMRLEADDPTRLRDELRCIVEFMDHDMKNTFSTQRSIQEGTKKTIAFDYLWLLFKPGDVVISAGQQKRAYIVLHVTGGRALERKAKTTGSRDKPREVSNYAIKEQEQEKEAYLAKYSKTTPFVIDCFYVDFDGKNFGPLPQKFMLAEFEGEKPITSLEVFPLRFDDNPKNTERLLAKRGKRFAKLARVDHKYYSGKTVTEPKILENQGEVFASGIVQRYHS